MEHSNLYLAILATVSLALGCNAKTEVTPIEKSKQESHKQQIEKQEPSTTDNNTNNFKKIVHLPTKPIKATIVTLFS